jgi:hypothetical protein
MILFFENGRLGNQLFQYYGFRNYFSNHKLYFFGFKSLKALFNNLNIDFIDIKNKIIFKLFKRIIFVLAKVRFIGTISETEFAPNVPSINFKIIIQRGILWNIFIAQRIYFQDKKCVDFIKNQLFFKENIIKKAKKWLKKKIKSKKYNLVFVHIRRGDYLWYPTPEHPAVLDLSWYIKSMSYLIAKLKNPLFILMSDDLKYLKKNFNNYKNLIISENSAEVDLVIMAMCSHGIMSPSTFAWWGSYFINFTKTNKKKSYFIAPKFWAGHRLKKWLPYKNFVFNWLSYR